MPVLTEGWYVDGVSVEAHGTVLENRTGWDDVPAMRGQNATLLGRHGQSWRRKRYDQGTKILTIGVHGADTSTWVAPATSSGQRALYESNLDALLRMFAPRHRLLDVVRVYASGERRQAQCEVTSAFAPQVAGQSYGQVSVELVVPGAFWEDADSISHRLAYSVADGGEQECEAYGYRGQTGYATDAVVVIAGPCSTVSVADTETGSGFSYASPVGAGETLTVDSGEFTAVLDDGTPASILTALTLTTSPTLLEISPAPDEWRGPSLTVTTTGASDGFSVTVTGRRKWLR